mgnify:CR=1 FL=1
MKYIFFIGLDLVLYPFLVLLYICQLIFIKTSRFLISEYFSVTSFIIL